MEVSGVPIPNPAYKALIGQLFLQQQIDRPHHWTYLNHRTN